MIGIEAHQPALGGVAFSVMLERLLVALAVVEHLAEREVQMHLIFGGDVTPHEGRFDACDFR